MSFKKLISILLCAVMFVTAIPVWVTAEEYVGEYVEGEAIFRYTQTVNNIDEFCKNGNIPQELSEIGINRVKELPVDQIYDTSIKTNPDSTKTKEFCFVGYFDGDVLETCKKLEKLDSVISATPNTKMQEDAISIPTEVTSPTNLYTSYTKWWMEDMLQITDAWSQFDTLGEGVLVAVLDSGFNIDNPEFTGRVWEDSNGNRGYNAVTYTNDVSPDSTHGTNVASIIVGASGYNRSVIGVAPKSQFIPIKVSTNANLISFDAIIAGINYAISHNVDIISMSVSSSNSDVHLQAACKAAYDAGIILVASAGNNGSATTRYPAAYDFVIGVMACGSDGQLCNFSNYDPSLKSYNIAAPGYRILGAYGDDKTIKSCTVYSGTSQATPIISGLAALYLSVYPDHTPEEFCRSLELSSTDTVTSNPSVVTNTTYTFPVVNALKLLNYPDIAPTLFAIAGSTAVIDDENSFIYGLEQSFASIETYIGVNDGSYEIIPTKNGYGTGSIVRIYTNTGAVFRDYEIVIFGDTDGDAVCDGRDTLLCDYVVAGGLVPDCIKFACDVDFDNKVTATDSGIISRCGIFTDFVTQIR